MIAGTASAKNVLLQQAPAAPETWAATTKVDISDLTGPDGQQTGLVVWQSENPNNFVKIVFIHKPDGVEWFEYVLTTNGNNVRLPNTGALNNLPDEVYLRVVSDGASTLTPQYSVDGEDWRPIGDPITELGTNVKVGLKISAGSGRPERRALRLVPRRLRRPRGAADDGDGAERAPRASSGGARRRPRSRSTATDGAAGSGVEKIEYRLGPDQPWQTYNGPFTITDPGRYVVHVPLGGRGRQPRAAEDARAVGRPGGADHDGRRSHRPTRRAGPGR